MPTELPGTPTDGVQAGGTDSKSVPQGRGSAFWKYAHGVGAPGPATEKEAPGTLAAEDDVPEVIVIRSVDQPK